MRIACHRQARPMFCRPVSCSVTHNNEHLYMGNFDRNIKNISTEKLSSLKLRDVSLALVSLREAVQLNICLI